MSFDRYSRFRIDGKITKVPIVTLTEKSSDCFEVYKAGITRLDNLSYKYYGDSNYDWLIMMANKQYGSLEFEIPDGAELRIPYPLNVSIDSYELSIRKYYELN